MEIIVYITLLFLASAFLIEKLTNFVKQLHTTKPKGLLGSGKQLRFNLTISSEDKKSEVCGLNTNSKNNLD